MIRCIASCSCALLFLVASSTNSYAQLNVPCGHSSTVGYSFATPLSEKHTGSTGINNHNMITAAEDGCKFRLLARL